MTARYRAPAEDGGLLAEPPPDRLRDQLAANARLLNSSPVRIAGVPLAEFRGHAVAEVTEAARRYMSEAGEPVPAPATGLLVAGHQPEFFHPGVWAKDFVLNSQARRFGRAPLNLIVDNDAARPATVRVPVAADRPGKVRGRPLPFDRAPSGVPYEEYRVADRGLFDSFPERLGEVASGWGFEPMAGAVWPSLQSELDRGATFGDAVSRVRRAQERRWGAINFELPVSRLAGTRAFAGFVCAVLGDLPRFADCYNAALRTYRKLNGLRSPNHPAPDLERRGEVVEAPFWAWRADVPRRAKLFVRRAAGTLELYAGDRPIGRVPEGRPACIESWRDLAGAGWKIRPRALTLTLFVRVCLADGFIHGIGGGKYDEGTDDIVRGFFGIDPPGYAVVSATLRLPLRRFPATADALHAAQRRVRDLEWNPQRAPEARIRFPELVARKAELIREEPAEQAGRRARFRQLQELTRRMREAVAGQIPEAESGVARLRAGVAANAILANREYAWPLFPEGMLRDYFSRLR